MLEDIKETILMTKTSICKHQNHWIRNKGGMNMTASVIVLDRLADLPPGT
jgi:hypothetical protein